MSSFDLVARACRSPLRDGTRAYTEEGLERKLRKEFRLPLHPIPGGCDPSLARALLLEQLGDLCTGLGLSPRQREIALLRALGWTVREIATALGIRRQSVERHYRCLREAFGSGLAEAERRMAPGRVPHYGWQEVYLESLRRR